MKEVKVCIPVSEAWDKTKDYVHDVLLIAQGVTNSGSDIKVYSNWADDSAELSVFVDSDVVYYESLCEKEEYEEAVNKVLLAYLDIDYDEDDDEDDGVSESAENYAILEREGELKMAAEDFLEVALYSSTGGFTNLKVLTDDEVDEMLDHFLEYLARRFDIKGIYRPMYLRDDKNELFYTEEPYKRIIYEDEDNKVYKPNPVYKKATDKTPQ